MQCNELLMQIASHGLAVFMKRVMWLPLHVLQWLQEAAHRGAHKGAMQQPLTLICMEMSAPIRTPPGTGVP